MTTGPDMAARNVTNFDPSRVRLGSMYRSVHGQLNRLPKTKWTLIVLAAVIILIDNWFIWPVLAVALVIAVVWLGCLVLRPACATAG